jgi:hypothetical protein
LAGVADLQPATPVVLLIDIKKRRAGQLVDLDQGA